VQRVIGVDEGTEMVRPLEDNSSSPLPGSTIHQVHARATQVTAQFKDIMEQTDEVLCEAKMKANATQREMCLRKLA
jgi:hypothetical protein